MYFTYRAVCNLNFCLIVGVRLRARLQPRQHGFLNPKYVGTAQS